MMATKVTSIRYVSWSSNKNPSILNAFFSSSQYKLRTYTADLAVRFRNAATARDYGKSVQWPRPPLVGAAAESGLQRMFRQWRARMILRRYPRSEWPQLRLQMIAASALRQRRKFWGQERRWTGNYLASSNENSNYSSYAASVNNMRNANEFTAVLFSAFVRKFNRFNKSADRAVVITESAVYKLETVKGKFKKMKQSLALRELSGLSVSPGRDQLVIFHTPHGNDLIVALQGEDHALKEDRVGELVGLVCKQYTE